MSQELAGQPLLYKPSDAAKILGIGRTTLYELMASGALPSVKIGHSRRISHWALQDYVARLTHEDPAAS